MATYKKRGGKSKNKAEDIKSTTAEVFKTLDESASKSEQWIAKNQKYILGVIAVAVIGVLGYLGYQKFILEPKETEASTEAFSSQQHFEQAINDEERDSLFNLAIQGENGKSGFLDVIENYKGTKTANVTHYRLGMTYLKTNKYQEAITHLEQFSSDDMMLNALAKGGIGDAFLQLNQPEDALSYYEQAFNDNENDFTTPRFLFKAGIVAMELKNYEKALTYFNRIKDEFSEADEAKNIGIFIGKAESLN